MLFSHQWMIREFISSKGWLKQRSFFSLSVIRLECQLHPKSNISILFANFLLLSVIMHRHQSSLLAVFAILVPLFAAVRCYWGWSGDSNLFSVYLLCSPPPCVGELCEPRCDQTLMITLSLRQCGGGQGADTWSSAPDDASEKGPRHCSQHNFIRRICNVNGESWDGSGLGKLEHNKWMRKMKTIKVGYKRFYTSIKRFCNK